MILYSPQVRFEGELGEMMPRYYLHDETGLSAFHSYEAALNDARNILAEALTEYPEDEPVVVHPYTVTQEYPREQGGGFWFECPECDNSGRVLVREIHVKEAT